MQKEVNRTKIDKKLESVREEKVYMKTRKKKQTKRVLAGTLAALMTVSAVPVSNSVVHAEKSQDRSKLKLKYSSAAPDSYDGWEKWSLPIGNSGIGASVFGGGANRTHSTE